MPTTTELPIKTESPAKNQQNLLRIGLIVVIALIVAGGATYWFMRGRGVVAMTTPYQAVLLTNGSAYFGRLEGLGTPFPVLRDVFYVQSTQDPQTKQVT